MNKVEGENFGDRQCLITHGNGGFIRLTVYRKLGVVYLLIIFVFFPPFDSTNKIPSTSLANCFHFAQHTDLKCSYTNGPDKVMVLCLLLSM